MRDQFVKVMSPSLNIVKKFIRDVSAGLCELHSKNMAHTDLKFENILVDILSDKLNKIAVGSVNELKLCDKYNELINNNIPENFEKLDKSKKKKLREKNKGKNNKKIRNIPERK